MENPKYKNHDGMQRIVPRARGSDLILAEEHARSAKHFANHQIVERDHRSWKLKEPYKKDPPGWDLTGWFEVTIHEGGRILFMGDWDHVFFAHYGSFKDPETVLRWIGASRDFGWYVKQKADIGMGRSNGCMEERDEEYFFHEIFDYITDSTGYIFVEGQTINPYDIGVDKWLADLLDEALNGSDINELVAPDSPYMTSDAWEAGVSEWGTLPSGRLVNAYQGLRRLVQLLDEEHRVEALRREESVGDGG